jgi:MFS family permease
LLGPCPRPWDEIRKHLMQIPECSYLTVRSVYIATLSLYMVFIMASALAPNIGAQLAFRFLAGFFGSTPLTCAGGSISDLWSPMERVFAFPVFANAAFTGPVIGPVLGGFIAQSSAISWRWTEWTTLIMSGLVLLLVVLLQPETYPPILLRWKAKHMRDVYGESRYVSEMEIRGEPFLQRLRDALYRPFLLTIREPIIILVALYLTVIYIVLFTFLDGYESIFGEIHGVSQGITGLCFLGIVIGLFGASALVPLIYKWAKSDLKKIKEQGGTQLPPEFRLWFSMLGGAFAIPISLFWMGWTSYVSCYVFTLHEYSLTYQGMDLHLVTTSGQCSLRVWHSLRLHLLVSVHHRQLRNVCRLCPGVRHFDQICDCWRHDCRRHSVLPQHGRSLDIDDLGLYKRTASPRSLSFLLLRKEN